MSEFDDIFSRKAKEAFENYDAEHLADEGWNAYVTRHGRKRDRAIIIPFWSRAAAILILIAGGMLLFNLINDGRKGEPADRIAQEGREEMADSSLIKDDTALVSPAIMNSVEPTAAGEEQALQAGQGKPGYKVSETALPVLAESIKTSVTPSPVKIPVEETNFNDAVLTDESHVSSDIATYINSATVNLAAIPSEIRLTEYPDTRVNLHPKKAQGDYLDIPRERMTTSLMTGFSGMMASIDNMTSASQGISIGFYVEQQLTRRIAVRPGLAMARHNYTMESTGAGNMSSGGGIAFDYAVPELNGMTGSTTSFDAVIDVVSMEVPVNLVFSVWKRARSNLFVTTGASTVLYLSQHMTGSFNNTYTRTTVDSYGEVSYESMTTSVEIESDHELLNRADILGLANFSAGYSFPFARSSQLLFEPFIQLPVRDLTSLNLRIRYGGLSMKIRF